MYYQFFKAITIYDAYLVTADVASYCNLFSVSSAEDSSSGKFFFGASSTVWRCTWTW